MAGEIAIAVPRSEDLMKLGAGAVGAGVTGLVEGVAIKMAPQLFGAALELPFTWATVFGVPLVGIGGALFTRGILGDLFTGVAAGGIGVAGYVLPSMVAPEMFQARKQVGGSPGVKQLTAGPLGAPQRAQAMAAKQAVGSWAQTPQEARGVVGQGHTVRDYA